MPLDFELISQAFSAGIYVASVVILAAALLAQIGFIEWAVKKVARFFGSGRK